MHNIYYSLTLIIGEYMKKEQNTQKYYSNIENIKPEIYYHYTSLEALLGIIKNQSFRLTNLVSSNDRRELSYKLSKFIKDVKFIYSTEKNLTYRNILKLFINSYENNKDSFKKKCTKTCDVYGLCLSEKKDNLTHWDRYADGCKGVCIGINVSAFEVYAQRMNNIFFGRNIISNGKVLYDDVARRDNIKKFIIEYSKYVSNNQYLSDEMKVKIIEDDGYRFLSLIYLKLRNLVKNLSFVDEDEIRLYFEENSTRDILNMIQTIEQEVETNDFLQLKESYNKMINSYNLNNINFYISKYGIRSYKELSLKEIWGSGLITEIMLGPMCSQSQKELKKLLEEYSLEDTIISMSKVPIR